MPTVKLNAEGKVILNEEGKVSCECCPPVGPVLTVACTSLTATPTLCGYSAYEDENAGPVYKWRRRTLSGGGTNCYYDGDCTTPIPALSDYNTNTGECYFDPETCTLTEAGYFRTYSGNCTGTGGTLSDEVATCSVITYSISTSISRTQTTKHVTGNQECGEAIDPQTITVDTTETLSEPDTIEDAIARAESPVEGTSCCAVTSDSIGTTTAESMAPISVGESTSVTMALSITGGAPSTDYVLTLVFKNYVTDPSSEEAETTMEIELTTDVSGEWADDVAIPQPDPNHSRCYDRYTLDLA